MIFNRIPIWVNLKRIKLLKGFRSLIIEYFNNIEPISYLEILHIVQNSKLSNMLWTYTRYRGIIILVRLDIDGHPHTNPEVNDVPLLYLVPYNGQTIQCPHLHLYVEGYMDKWAIPAPANEFLNTKDLYQTLEDFFRYCNIIEPPIIQRGLFA